MNKDKKLEELKDVMSNYNMGIASNTRQYNSPWGNTDPIWLSLLLLALDSGFKDSTRSKKDLTKIITDSDLSNEDKKSILNVLMK